MSGDTIFALASGGGRVGLAVVRVSGPGAGAALRRLTGRDPPPSRRATRAVVRHPDDGEVLDDGLVVWFPGPASYTGEDVVELHLHGGRAVCLGVLEALAACPGLRPAEAGEFTRRAFANRKLDLTAAEAVADLVDAETAAQRRQALRQLGGELERLYEDWRQRLLRLLAHMEASIDFSDEALPATLESEVRGEAAALGTEMARHLDDARRGERLRDGLHVAIIGAPNVGKSSLLNTLARRDAAIVSTVAGTTRDVIEVHLDLGGYPLTIADTAGLRESTDAVELEGVRRARRRAEDADLRLAVFDAEAWPKADAATAALVDTDTLVVVNKADLVQPAPPLTLRGRPAAPISALRGDGIDGLLADLGTALGERWESAPRPAPTRARHRAAVGDCQAALTRALAASSPELAAEDLRLAARALGRITGRVEVEDLLDVIFADFCIGK
jgi:tRNA modification GTPase